MNDLQIHEKAAKDLRFSSYPSRDQNGQYLFSIGQQEVLIQDTYAEDLRKIEQKRLELLNIKDRSKNEMLLYGPLTDSQENDANKQLGVERTKIDDEQKTLKELQTQLAELEEDMRARGISTVESPSPIRDKPSAESKPTKKLAVVWSFFIKWAITEGVMLVVQWTALRQTKGYIDLAVRSFYFGVVIFLLEYISLLNKKKPKPYYRAYLILTLFMLVVMIGLPPILNELYPANTAGANIADQWNVSEGTSAPNAVPSTENPIWVDFYRANEYLQAIICVILFIGIQIFTIDKKMVVPPTTQPDNTAPPAGNTFLDQQLNLKTQIRNTELRIEAMEKAQAQVLSEITSKLRGYLDDLAEFTENILSIDRQSSDLKIESEVKLKQIEKQLQIYKMEFEYLRNNDIIKQHSMTTPPWPEMEDICKYYNIQPI